MISIVVATYNRAKLLAETLESLNVQQVAPKITTEIIVVDNNSKDNTKEIVENFMSRSRWPVHYIFEPRQGVSFARNSGIEKSTGDYVAILDDDVIVDPNWLQALNKFCDEIPADLIGGKIIRKWDFIPPDWYTDEIGGAFVAQEFGPVRTNSFEKGRFFLTANVVFRKKIFEKIGYFNTRIGRRGTSLAGCEDSDIFQRIHKAKGAIWYEPLAIVAHPVEEKRMTKSYLKQWFYEVGRTRGYQMEWQKSHWVTILPLWEWSEFLKATKRYLLRFGKKTEAEKFSSYVWFLHHWGIFVERFLVWLPFGWGKSLSIFKNSQEGQ